MISDLSELQELLKPHGLILRGILAGSEVEEIHAAGDEFKARQLVLVGNAGSAIWRPFNESPEFSDALANPLDRWSRRIGEDIARQLGGSAIFPWEGPPYPPFLAWARISGQVFPSPVSMFVHGDYGLWHAYRFALVLPESLSGIEHVAQEVSPCINCPQPCLDACPVDAFDSDGYRVDHCVDYLREDEKSSCREQGCAARRACPVGSGYGYEAHHAQFHMAAFLKSRPLESQVL
jgi:hypothetical protein